MKKFKIKPKNKIYININLLLIITLTIFLLTNYNHKISPKIEDISSAKLEEITTLYIKNNVAPIKADLSKLISITKNNKDEILTTDVDYNYAYDIMVSIIKRIQNDILKLENGNISNFSNSRELKCYNNNLYLKIPLGLSQDGNIFSSLGPKLPIKVSFYEHVLGTIKTTITEYGINNALLKVTLIIDLEQKLIFPYKSLPLHRQYELELGAKIIIGTVPNIYGGSLVQKSQSFSSETITK